MDTTRSLNAPLRAGWEKSMNEKQRFALAEGHDTDALPPDEGPPAQDRASSNDSVDLEKNETITCTTTEQHEEKPKDPNEVDWDGPIDPTNPMNWTSKRKWLIVALISAMTFATPLGSTIFAPGVPLVMKEFNSTNTELASFMVSVYILGFAFGPIITALLSELYSSCLSYMFKTCSS